MKPHVHADNRNYQRHLDETKTAEHQAMCARIRNTFASPSGERGEASDADLVSYAQWEMREASWWLEPAVLRSDEDGFHASCCLMRANAALEVLARRSR